MREAVIVVGLGSMGRRRIRLLRELAPDIQIGGIDAREDRRDMAEREFAIRTYSTISAAVKELNPFAGLVCTSPLSHRAIIMELLEYRLHVFTELNLVADGYPEMMERSKDNGVTLFLSSTMLYRKDIRYLIGQTEGKTVNYCVHTGQYLPDWHPWENYQNYFIGDKKTNGCRECFAIDLPWIIRAFGEVSDFNASAGKLTGLNVDYPDNYIVSLHHKNGSKGVFLCDVVTRKGGRWAEIFNENLYIRWDGTPDSLFQYDLAEKELKPVSTYSQKTQHLTAYSNSSIVEDAYKEELSVFLQIIRGRGKAEYTLEDDLKTLALIDRIEGLA